MVDVLVFSKDRAAQLDLLLRSIKRFAPRFYRSVTVLYAYSEPCYREGYERLLYPMRRNLLFVHQRDFEQQVRHWLEHSDGPVSFLCDDDVFYAPAPPAEELRLPWSLRGGDYDYPFSLDGNVYRPEWIRRLLARFSFANPTQLEARGHEHRHVLPFDSVSGGVPCLVGVPLNRVSVDSRMPSFGVHEFDLNEQWLNGEPLELNLPSPPYGTHLAASPLVRALA